MGAVEIIVISAPQPRVAATVAMASEAVEAEEEGVVCSSHESLLESAHLSIPKASCMVDVHTTGGIEAWRLYAIHGPC